MDTGGRQRLRSEIPPLSSLDSRMEQGASFTPLLPRFKEESRGSFIIAHHELKRARTWAHVLRQIINHAKPEKKEYILEKRQIKK